MPDAPAPLRCRDRTLTLGKTLVMGVVNVTPDSFSDGGRFDSTDSAIEQARRLVAEGADIVDIGGESSRPGADPVSAAEEEARVLPVLSALEDLEAVVSVDTCKPRVARAALEAGCHMINDITGAGAEMLEVAARFSAPVVAMHMQGEPRTMQKKPRYDDVVSEVEGFFVERLRAARAVGVGLLLDPGIGFGKTLEHNLELLRATARFGTLGAPVVIGTSRKSFLGKITGRAVEDRLAPSLASSLLAAVAGADVVRVHDVAEHVAALRVLEAWAAGPSPSPSTWRVRARGVRCPTRIGVEEEERERPQEVVVDLVVELATAGGGDALSTTMDYATLAEVARRVSAAGARRLLETLAEEIAEEVAEVLDRSGRPAAREILVRIEKPAVASSLGGREFGVEVRRR